MVFRLIGEIMAEAKTFSLDTLERIWIKKAVDLQVKSLRRSMDNEVAGSEIRELRMKELVYLQRLMEKLS